MRIFRLYSLNEVTIVRFAIDCLLRREVVIVSLRPIFVRSWRLLERLSIWARSSGRACNVVEMAPELAPYVKWSRQLYFCEAFSRIEPWQERKYGFDDVKIYDSLLHHAFKAVTCNFTYDQVFDIYAIDALAHAFPGDRLDPVGIPSDTIDMYRGSFAERAISARPAYRLQRALSNLLIAGGALAWSWLEIVKRIRPLRSGRSIFCMLDALGNKVEHNVLEEVHDGGSVVILDRRTPGAAGEWNVDAYERCRWGEGYFGIVDGFVILGESARDIFRLWRCHRTISLAHFIAIIMLPLKRAKWRALFTQYRTKHYLGRDEYNPDHILRRSELHRIGGVSHGWSGGIYTAYARIAPNARYISFDHYYCIGTGLFETFRSRWPNDMAAHSVGSFGFPRDMINAGWPRGDVVLVAMRIAFGEPEYHRMVHMLSRAFPDRSIVVQIKSVDFLAKGDRVAIVEALTVACPNVVSTDRSIYDLMSLAACMVSDISTIVSEGIHLGIPTYVADLVDQDYCVYREFPGLCIRSAEALVAAVGSVLNDPTSYPFDDFRRRMNLDISVGYDVVRRQMGLPPVGQPKTAQTC